MGSISESIASSARDYGVEIVTNANVSEIVLDSKTSRAAGVRLTDGSVLNSKVVISGASPRHTIVDLLSKYADNNEIIPKQFYRHIENAG
jgi:phytoene dehydrogenase-like protein